MSARRRLVVLGATGTVGRQTLELIRDFPDLWEVVGISAHSNQAALKELAQAHPEAQSWLTSQDAEREALLPFLQEGNYDVCLHAMVGAAGLPFSEAVLRAGRTLALANKESLVLGGAWLCQLAREHHAEILPVDSEHSAIHQCLHARTPADIRTLYLTASGGALRDLSPDEQKKATPTQVLNHPNWDMGPRITVDSATMMNKVFEIIEAHHLFETPASQIQVLVHRQSIIHSMVEFQDGSILAQMGPPDMKFPIHYALFGPDRQPSPLQGFSPELFQNLTLEPARLSQYPALALAQQALDAGPAGGAVLNAADEIAVEAFLAGQIPFHHIVSLCETTLQAIPSLPGENLALILAADAWARDFAQQACATPPL
jgi:1-deoxy-D-xylulose-5-phosphate reductoisomerase